MTRDEIFAHVTRQMAEMFELDPVAITADALLREDLGLDSIDAIDLATKIEQFTGKRVEEADLRGVLAVKDVVDLIERIASSEPAAMGLAP